MKLSTVAGLAFALAILVAAKASTLNCSSRETLYPGDTYTIQSPNYPNNYPKKARCSNFFKVHKTCKEPQFVCNEFDVRGNLPKCKGGDKLIVKTKILQQGKQVTKFCGDQPISFSAPGSNRLNFFFRSNWRNQRSGYSCQVSCGGTTAQTTTDATGGPSTSAGPCNCGLPNRVTRIVGGVDTEANEYPWQVGLIISGLGAPANHPVCGGSLITTKTVLTAAHCTDGGSARDYQVLVGEHDTSIKDGEFKVKVKRIIQHPQYNQAANTDNDFSLLILQTAVEWSNSVRPVCLPAKQSADYENIEAIVSGWGRTSSGGPLSSILQEVDVATMTNSACTSGTQYHTSDITNNMLCAAEKDMNGGKDACQGDSGGPLITKETDNSYSQIGVVSWGLGCAQADAPGVYSRVTQQLQWIQNNMQGDTCPSL